MKKAMVPVVFLIVVGFVCVSCASQDTDWRGLGKSTLKATGSHLAGSLAEQFGVPAASVNSLFESGLSLQGVVQALLIAQSAKVSVGEVSSLLGAKRNDVSAVANELGVSASAYAQDKVDAAIRKASGTAGTVLDAADQVKSAPERARGDVDATVDALTRPPR